MALSQLTSLLCILLAVLCSTATYAFTPFGLPSRNTHLALGMARRNFNKRGPPILANKPPMNQELPSKDLRVTTPNPKGGKDEPLGVMNKEEALALAKKMGGLDVILVNPNSDPPVCKIVDYSKYRYMQEKKAKEVKKNSKATEIKEVKMSYKIDVHDYEVRTKNALKFLNQGNRVKCTVMFRGREVQHDKLGFELLEKIAAKLEAVAVKDGKPKREGRNLSLIISPKPEVLKLVNANRRAEDIAKKKKKEETWVTKAAEVAAAAADGEETILSGVDGDDADDDELDLESDIESSLDDLFGSDDLTDDLFR
jgi:translation initiation factor IF-3